MLEALDRPPGGSQPAALGKAIELTEEAMVAAPESPVDRAAGPSQQVPEDPTTRLRPQRKLDETELDMTPMVDVTFLLLIFFMVTAAFSLQKSLEVPKPSDQDPSTNVVQEDPQDQADFVTVRVDEFNTYQVMTVDWEEEAPSEQDLHVLLRRARDGDSTGTVPTKLRVEAHGDSLHEKVIAAVDAGNGSGFEEVQLATIEDT